MERYLVEVDGRDRIFDHLEKREALLLDDTSVMNVEGRWKEVISIEDESKSIIKMLNKEEKLPLEDYARFRYKIWPIADGENHSEMNKYNNPVHVLLNQEQEDEINFLLETESNDGWNLNKLTKSLKILLPAHRDMMYSNEDLPIFTSYHVKGIIGKKNEIEDFNAFQEALNRVISTSPLVVFRTLTKDYIPRIEVGNVYLTEDVWSTSYYPLSSFSFGISVNRKEKPMIYVLRAMIPADFEGGLLIEDDPYTSKIQYEMVIASGKSFRVDDIKIVPLHLTDSIGNITRFTAKIYYLTFL